MSPQELAQGFRDDVVLARPVPSHVTTIDAEEAKDGTVMRRAYVNLRGVRVLAVRAGETPDQAIARLRATGRYAYVERDRLLHTTDTTPNDPDFGQQWALANTGSNSPLAGVGIVGADIHAPAAWDIRHDASQVLVATVDTGVLTTHEDLIGNLWTNPSPGSDGHGLDIYGIDAIDGAFNPGDPTDDVGHGTHVAGIIGAIGNNGDDISGVAWTAQIMALKFLGPNGTGGATSEELTCLSYALAHGVKIVNASFGSRVPSSGECDAIQQLQASGVIMVCAAGNEQEDNDLTTFYPASYPLDNIVAVAASDNRDDLASFSDYGSCVDLAAPGDTILSLYNTNNTATAILSGTSMATPMVTGSLALLEAQFPTDSYRQTINRLLRSVDANSNLTGIVQTGGRLNLAAALGSSATANTPFNDNFENRSHLAGMSVTVRANNTGATREANEPGSGNATLWWDWTAPVSGPVIITSAVVAPNGVETIDTAYSTVIGVYTGSALGSLASVQSSTAGLVTFNAVAGVTYDITIGSQTAATGQTTFNLFYNNITGNTGEAAIVLAGPSVSVTATAFTQPPSVYTWTAPSSGMVQVTLSSPDMDPVLQLSSNVGNTQTNQSATGGPINVNATVPTSVAVLSFYATQGTTYTLDISGQVDSGVPNVGGGQFTLAINGARWAGIGGDSFRASPSVAPSGVIYIGGDDSVLYAFNPDGSTRWTYTASGAFDGSSPAIGSDGTVYAGADDGYLYALSSAGTLNWKYAVTNATANGGTNFVASSPVVGADGTIYVKDGLNSLYALNPDGSLKWTATVPGNSYAAPAIGEDGTIYVCSDDGNGGGMLYAFKTDGTSLWTYNANTPIYTAPAIDSSGNIYFATLGGTLVAVNAQGQALWTYAAANSISSAPAIGSDGTVYFGCYDHNLYAVKAGALSWTCALGGEVRASAPSIDGNGVIYVGCYDGKIYAVNANGSVQQTFATAGWVRSSPAIFGTTLYCGSNDHRVYAFDLGEGASGSAWSTYLASAQRDGRALSPALSITAQPNPSVALAAGSNLTLSVGAVGQGPLAFQWSLNGAAIAGANNSTYFVPDATASVYGAYTVTVSGSQGTLTSQPSVVSALAAPVIQTQPQSVSVATGASTTLTAVITGGNLTYQWSFGGVAISGATQPSLVLSNVGANQGSGYGSYTLTATNNQGSVTSSPASLTVVTQARLLNLSARAEVGPADLTAGFVINQGSKQVLLRGVGPALGGFGVSDPLANPQLTLFNGSETPIDSNTGWNSDLASVFGQVGAFSFPTGSADAALLESLASGQYTSQVAAPGTETGVALAEIYDADQGTVVDRIINISARAEVGVSPDNLVAGFVISGTTSETVLIRGVGPTLTSFGVTGVLAQPALTLFDSGGNTLYTNSGWANSTTVSSVSSAVGAFALNANSADAAIVVTLPPGQYTAQLEGAGSTTGDALVEVYEVR